jgi:hypothetical protein
MKAASSTAVASWRIVMGWGRESRWIRLSMGVSQTEMIKLNHYFIG